MLDSILANIFGLLGQLAAFDNLALIGIILIALIIAFKVFQFLIKALIIGLLFGLVAVGLWYVGLAVTVQHVLLAILFGVLFSIAYSAISGLAKGASVLIPKRKAEKRKEEK